MPEGEHPVAFDHSEGAEGRQIEVAADEARAQRGAGQQGRATVELRAGGPRLHPQPVGAELFPEPVERPGGEAGGLDEASQGHEGHEPGGIRLARGVGADPHAADEGAAHPHRRGRRAPRRGRPLRLAGAFPQRVEHVLDGLYARDRLFAPRPGVGDGAGQTPAYVHRAAAHSPDDPALARDDGAVENAPQDQAPRPVELGQDADDLQVERLDLGAAEDRLGQGLLPRADFGERADVPPGLGAQRGGGEQEGEQEEEG